MTTSTEVLAIMKAIEKNLDDLTGRVASIDKYMDPTNPSSLKRARDDLEEIGEALTTSLDYQESLANIISGKTPFPPSITSATRSLLQHVHALQGYLDNSIRVADQAMSKEPAVDSELRREEIGKLLMLVAKAKSLNYVTFAQYESIKDSICRREAFLRPLLEVEDMNVVMNSLKSIF